jgi:hypothetical protein
MGGVTRRDDELVVERSANELDELAIAFSEVLSRLDIDHVSIAGYVPIPPVGRNNYSVMCITCTQNEHR